MLYEDNHLKLVAMHLPAFDTETSIKYVLLLYNGKVSTAFSVHNTFSLTLIVEPKKVKYSCTVCAMEKYM